MSQGSAADREIVISRLLDAALTKYGAIEGGRQTLERLAEHVEKK